MLARSFNVVLGLAILWMLAALPLAAIAGDGPALWIVTAVLLGPFMAYGVVFVLAFAASLIFYGEPDRLVDKLHRGE